MRATFKQPMPGSKAARVLVGSTKCARVVRLLLAALLLCVPATRSGLTYAGDPTEASEGVRQCVVSGQIVDEDGQSVAGANVAWIGNAPAGDDSSAAAERTDAAGAFRLTVQGPADAELRGTIHATSGDQLAEVLPTRVPIGIEAQDEGALQLLLAQPLAVDIRSAGVPVANAVVWAWTWRGNIYWGQTVHLGSATTGSDGQASFAALPGGYFQLLARAPDGRQAEKMRQVVLGHSTRPIRMKVEPSRTVRVRVVDATEAAQPIEGAVVTRDLRFAIEDVTHNLYVHLPARIPPTSSDGYTQVEGLPSSRGAKLIVRAPGRPTVRASCNVGEATTTIVVPDPTEIEVNEGERPAPPDGTRLLIRPRKSRYGVVEGWMRKGAIVAPMPPHLFSTGVAVAPDGSIAPLHRAKPTSFFAARSLALRIVEEGAGGTVQTHVALASVPSMDGPWDDPVLVDAQGRARFDALPPWTYRVYGFPTSRSTHGGFLGEVDLSAGNVTRDLVVGKERVVRLQMKVDDQPGIPQAPWWNVDGAVEVGAEVDRAASEIRLRVRPRPGASGGGSIHLGGRGVRSRELAVAWPAGGETVAIDVKLRSAPQVVADVRQDPGGESDVYVERWCPWHHKTPWVAAHSVYPHLTGQAVLRLDEGRYRLHDALTGIVSAPFEVPEHGGSVRAVIDLTNLVTISGRIACLEGADCSELEVGIEGDGIDTHLQFGTPFRGRLGLPCNDGRFAVRVPAGVAVTLRPCLTSLLPAHEGGEVTLVGPRDDVVLKAGPGATAIVRLVDVDGAPLLPKALSSVEVVAIPSEYPRRPPVTAVAEPVGGRPGYYAAPGLPFGTLDLWIVPSRETYATAARKGVRVDSETVDLGAVQLTAGSRVVVRLVESKDGPSSISEVRGHAMGLFGPREWRNSRSRSGALCQCVGLSAGRWHITLYGTRTSADGDESPAGERTFEVEVDGKSDQTLEVDFSE